MLLNQAKLTTRCCNHTKCCVSLFAHSNHSNWYDKYLNADLFRISLKCCLVRILIIVVKMNHIFPFSTNECYNYTNLKTTIRVLTPKSAGWQPT